MERVVRSFAQDLTRHRRYNYSQEPLEEFLHLHPHILSANFRIPNPRGHLLDTLILKKGHNDSCILYAHGLGSNKLEALSISKFFLKQGYDVCSFDFSGSGRSEGDMTTYGLHEKEDLLTVLKHLDCTENYSRVVLWGRSMGAVSVVLAQEQEENSKVECLVLDSPFSSFEKIAIEIASKKSLLPQFMISMLIQPLKSYFSQHKEVNPFCINLQKALKRIEARILLIYSPNDSIINFSHSKAIVQYCKRNPVQLVINEDHNMQRSKSTFSRTLTFIRDSAREVERRLVMSRTKNRGISVASKDTKDNKQRESIRSISKIKLIHPSASKLTARQASTTKYPQRHIRTIATLSESIQYNKRIETDSSPIKRRTHPICSIFLESKLPDCRLIHYNKENIKPSFNLLRKNRFR